MAVAGKTASGDAGGAREGERTDGKANAGSRSMTVSLPFVTAKFRRPDIRVPGGDDLAGAVDTVRGYLPSPGQAAYYGSLGALAALSVIEWPVAAAIGVGTVVARRSGRGDSDSSRARSRSDGTSA